MTPTLTLLDRPAFEVFEDRVQLDRLVQAICLERPDLDYLGALELFQESWGRARLERGPGMTVKRVLSEYAGVPADSVAGDVRLLERRDTETRRMLDASKAGVADDELDATGQVKLPKDADVGKLLADPQEFERRLARMRKVDGAGVYVGDQERDQFRSDDRQHIEAGLDMVRTAERHRELAAARARARQFGEQLDTAMGGARDTAERVKELDAQIASLAEQRAALLPGTVLPSPLPTQDGSKLLDQAQTAATGDGSRPVLTPDLVRYALDNGLAPLLGIASDATAPGTLDGSAHAPASGDQPASGAVDALRLLEDTQPRPAQDDLRHALRPLLRWGSSVTRAGFQTLVKAHQAQHRQPWPVAALAVAKRLAPNATPDDVKATGLLEAPED